MKQLVVMAMVCSLFVGTAFVAEKAQTNVQKSAKTNVQKNVQGSVTTTKSGLKYVDIKVGSGAEAKAGMSVAVHYTGWLYVKGKRGTKFDSSVGKEAFEFKIGAGGVIKGWEEGVAGMKVGGKRELIIPPDLGYGSKGRPPVIPPDSTMDFEVELLGVRK